MKQKKTWPSIVFRGLLAVVSALGLVAVSAAFVTPMFSGRMGVNVTLNPSSCSNVRSKHEQGFQHNALPCRFAAFLFPSAGGWVAVGKEGGMKDQCVLIPYANLNAKATHTRHFSAGSMKLSTMKSTCRGSFAVYHPKMRQGGWHQFWSWDQLAPMAAKEFQ